MSKNRKLKPRPVSSQAKKALSKIEKVGELSFLRMPDGKIAVTQLLTAHVPLADIIACLDQIQTHMIAAYELLGPETTGEQYINHYNGAASKPS